MVSHRGHREHREVIFGLSESDRQTKRFDWRNQESLWRISLSLILHKENFLSSLCLRELCERHSVFSVAAIPRCASVVKSSIKKAGPFLTLLFSLLCQIQSGFQSGLSGCGAATRYTAIWARLIGSSTQYFPPPQPAVIPSSERRSTYPAKG